MAADAAWWREAVFYHIYPRSFMDAWAPCPCRPGAGARPGGRCTCGKHYSRGDGIGDLPGIIDRLDYLRGTERSLKVDAIWLSPTYPSPMKDFGYDVADYRGVDPVFGAIAHMDQLIAACHARGLRLVLDWVPNHTSEQHEWFRASRSSRAGPKRDWYIWRDPRPDGGPPNNWLATFGGPAWTWDAHTGQYYLHSFFPEQPDLNWRNPAVVAAMTDTLRFWLARGVDGFRIDAVGNLLKDPDLPDNPANPMPDGAAPGWEAWAQLHEYDFNRPEVVDVVRAIRRVLDEYPGTVSLGEAFGSPETLARYYGGTDLDGLHLTFNFQLIRRDRTEDYTPWDAATIRAIVDRSVAGLPAGALPAWMLSTLDGSRLISRHNHDGQGRQRARLAALLLLTLPGVPVLYYGEEIGMENVPVPDGQARDPARFASEGRDPARTPMPWESGPGRGFTTGDPWLPFGDPALSVAAQQDDPASLLALYRRLIRLRSAYPALRHGRYRSLDGMPAAVFAYLRRCERDAALVALNFSGETHRLRLPTELHGARPVDGTHGTPSLSDGGVLLRPHEGIVALLT